MVLLSKIFISQPMRKFLLFIFILPFAAIGQDHFVGKSKAVIDAPDTKSTEFGVLGGVSFYNGETNPSSQLNPALSHGAGGIILRRNINSRWAFRLNGLWGKVKGNDLISGSDLQKRRGMVFTSHIYEFSSQFEFNFLPYCAANNSIYFTPYFFAGLGAFYFNPISHITGSKQTLAKLAIEGVNYSRISAALPFGFGFKGKLSHRFLVGIEWGVRKTWTDYIDDISTTYGSTHISERWQRGNSKNMDWYTIAGLTLTMRLGERPNNCERFGNSNM